MLFRSLELLLLSETCAVRKHSKCGRPSEIYHFQEIDAEAIMDSCGKVLSETALEKVIVSQRTFDHVAESADQNAGRKQHWTELWPTKNQSHKH